ncbi:serine protease Do-like HtrA [Bacillus subtilis]|nr:putative serine protease do-like protein htrA [Bacillus subtilis PY79]AIC39693.1 serine protease Do [Bacillus subtilis subsp. subtilis str. JH642 substr. AG174]AIC43925.1 serine protease Do [Bacillus subtilis subsp. subtilis str. AG1839]AKN13405.1 Serine protease, DegP/HtrA, do-like [Bacillus subtilis]AQR81256.1 Serine protease Do-like HtrA [Bacillus subtilis subsp. subtilis str. 168]EHA29912.1 serine protease Do (heat-shock protein) [Bacillus subtilis subsp. subtilis str. SC-8]EME07661.1 
MMDNYRDENRTKGNENEVFLTKENDQSASYSARNVIHDQEKKKRGFGWFRPLLGGVIGGSLALGIYTFTPLGDHDSQDTAKQSSSQQQTQSVTATSTSSESKKSSSSSSAFKSEDSSKISDMVEDLSPAIVGITNLQAQSNSSLFGSSSSDSSEDTESGSGSGVIFKKENGKAYIITNNHVVEGASSLKVSLYDGTEVTAKLVGSDSLTDLAVLQISDDHVTKVANFGDSSDLRTGETVIAIGDPLGKDLSRTVTQGIVSGVDRTVSMSTSAGETSINVIQTDAAINPGNSGGPLLNTDGKIVGINSMKISEDDVEGIGFAIPSNDVKPIAEELLSKGQIERPYIGVSMLDLEQVPQNYQEGTLGLFGSQLNKGVYIREVASGSPAEKAGLKAEDIIIGLKGKEIDTGSELRNILYKDAKIGDTVEVKILRNGKEMTKKIKLDQKEEKTS